MQHAAGPQNTFLFFQGERLCHVSPESHTSPLRSVLQPCPFHLRLCASGRAAAPQIHGPDTHLPPSHTALPFCPICLVRSKLFKNIFSPFLRGMCNRSLFAPSVKFCFELSAPTPAIWPEPSFHPPPSPLPRFVREGAGGCCVCPKGKACSCLVASRIRNPSESTRASALLCSSVTFWVSLGRLRLLCCFHQGQ